MRSPCNPEVLEALALSEAELPPAEAAAARAHAATCPDCQRELLWLRAERDLLKRRQQALAPVDLDHLYLGVAGRVPLCPPGLGRRGPGKQLRSVLWAAAAVLAAIVMQQGTGMFGRLISGFGSGGGQTDEPAGRATLSLSGPVHLLLQTGSADVEVRTGPAGQLLVEGGRDPIQLVKQAADRVEARFGRGGRLGDGNVRAVLPPGSRIELDTLSGDMAVKGALAQIRARSTSGKLEVEGDDPDLRFESVSGDLSFTGGCAKGCSMDLRTISGELDLRLSKRRSFALRYTTQSGDFSDELGGQQGGQDQGAVSASYGLGEGRIQASTVSGTLTLAAR